METHLRTHNLLKLFRFRAAAAIACRRLRDSAEILIRPLHPLDLLFRLTRGRTEIQCL